VESTTQVRPVEDVGLTLSADQNGSAIPQHGHVKISTVEEEEEVGLEKTKSLNLVEKTHKSPELSKKRDIMRRVASSRSLSIKQTRFKPDFAVEVIETTTYVKITRTVYEQAFKATLMERESACLPPEML